MSESVDVPDFASGVAADAITESLDVNPDYVQTLMQAGEKTTQTVDSANRQSTLPQLPPEKEISPPKATL